MRKEIYNKSPIITPQMGIGGEWRCILKNSMGGIEYDSGWFPNLITNTGLVNMYRGTGGYWYFHCHVGGSNTAPANTDTTLGSWFGVHSVGLTTTHGPTPVAPNYEYYSIAGYRFNAGVATGLIQELGLSRNSNNSEMSVRSIISPAINKLPSQILEIYYKFTIWPPIVDTVGVVSIEGNNYNYIARLCNANSTFIQNTFMNFAFSTSGSYCDPFQSTIGTITGQPNTQAGNDANSGTVVANGSGFSQTQYYFSVDNGNSNDGLGIRSFRIGYEPSQYKSFQFEFSRVSDSAKILKNSNKDLYLDVRLNWARRP